MAKQLEGLRKDQIWQGKDGVVRQVKSIIGSMVSYRVHTIASKFFKEAEFIGEANLIEADYFQRNFAITKLNVKDTIFNS